MAGKKCTAYIGLGSNLGNRKRFLREAIQNLPGVSKISDLYETDPVGYADQGPFLNMVVELKTDLSPRELLELCQAEEKRANRQRTILNGPRTLDLDLLWVKGVELKEGDLIVPHPRMFERGFVILPLSDLNTKITKDWVKQNTVKANGNKSCEGVWSIGKLNLKAPQLQVIKSKTEISEISESKRAEGNRIGLVPTMGGLHQGHLSLVEKSLSQNDVTILTIFANPLQFNDPKDFDAYPKDLERDLELLEDLGQPLIIFAPDQKEMLGEELVTSSELVPGLSASTKNLTQILEGKHRPGHFEGVCIIVEMLFSLVGKSKAYFSKKDYQQLIIVSGLVADLNLPIEIVACPTIREPDGLAMSSRNTLLQESHRMLAPQISVALKQGAEMIEEEGETNPAVVISQIAKLLDEEIQPEYIEIRDSQTLEEVNEINSPVSILIVAQLGKVRLIDNVEIGQND